jgi:hypothetical protein
VFIENWRSEAGSWKNMNQESDIQHLICMHGTWSSMNDIDYEINAHNKHGPPNGRRKLFHSNRGAPLPRFPVKSRAPDGKQKWCMIDRAKPPETGEVCPKMSGKMMRIIGW